MNDIQSNPVVNSFKDNIEMSDGVRLTRLCRSGDVSRVRAALSAGVDVNSKSDSDGSTGLIEAIRKRKSNVINMLLDHPDIDINLSAISNETPLHFACSAGDTVTITRLVRDRRLTTLNARDFLGITPIMMAVDNGHLPAVELMSRTPGVTGLWTLDTGLSAMDNYRELVAKEEDKQKDLRQLEERRRREEKEMKRRHDLEAETLKRKHKEAESSMRKEEEDLKRRKVEAATQIRGHLDTTGISGIFHIAQLSSK